MTQITFQITIDVQDEQKVKELEKSLQEHYGNNEPLPWRNFQLIFLSILNKRNIFFQNWSIQQDSMNAGLGSFKIKESSNKYLKIEVIAKK